MTTPKKTIVTMLFHGELEIKFIFELYLQFVYGYVILKLPCLLKIKNQ